MRRFRKIILIIPLILLYTCEDNNQKYFDLLFEATFKNNLAADTVKSFLVIQDTLGNVLADTSWSGDTHFKLFSAEDYIIPEKVSITFTTERYNNVNIDTYYKISSGTHWIWDEYYRNGKPVGDVEVTFKDIPDNSYAILSVKGVRSRKVTIVEGETYSLGMLSDISDLLIMLKTQNGALYKWIPEITVGTKIEIDLSDCNIALQKIIPLPDNCDYSNFYAYGYVNQLTHHNYKKFELLTNNHSPSSAENCTVYYPPNISSFNLDYACYQTVELGYNPHRYWRQTTYGDLPTDFQEPNIDIEIMDSDINNLVVYRTGDFDEYSLNFISDDYFWLMHINPNTGSSKLPNLPDSFYEAYPNFDKSKLMLYAGTAYDYIDVNGQEELYQLLMETDNIYIFDVVSGFRSRRVFAENL